MDFERVKVEVHGPVGVLRLNHPEVMNAVGPEMLKGLAGAMSFISRCGLASRRPHANGALTALSLAHGAILGVAE